MRNGILHVPSRRLLAHHPHFFTYHSLPYDFRPDAPEPEMWLDFLHELWPEDQSAIDTLQEILGYVLGGGTEPQTSCSSW